VCAHVWYHVRASWCDPETDRDVYLSVLAQAEQPNLEAPPAAEATTGPSGGGSREAAGAAPAEEAMPNGMASSESMSARGDENHWEWGACMDTKQGPVVLLCVPSRTHRILFIPVMQARMLGAGLQRLLTRQQTSVSCMTGSGRRVILF
jgi:hypothetical protein